MSESTHKKQRTPKTQDRPHAWSVALSILALVVSGVSLWDSHEARTVAYESALPQINATVELVEPLAPAKQIQFKTTLDNSGKTSAKQMSTMLAFKFQKSDVQFEALYPEKGAFIGPKADLAPGGHSTLYSTNPLSLAHDHDVDAVLNGQYRLYLYGKSNYRDIMGNSHEVHICRFYEKVVGSSEPLKLVFCDSYNDAN